jgi:hypothetical protein
VAVETPADKPRFAAMRLVPRVSSEEIKPLARERLATEAVHQNRRLARIQLSGCCSRSPS